MAMKTKLKKASGKVRKTARKVVRKPTKNKTSVRNTGKKSSVKRRRK